MCVYHTTVLGKKRVHTSNLGLGIIIDILSGLVLVFEVLSKYCHNCVVACRDMGVDSAEFHIWQKGHADESDKNFDGTSRAMEMARCTNYVEAIN
ncbi:uncharacterized protein TNCV_660841 [Trichonephila clavipes]|nr:uncharacterized protein TNCV_660841 [Trichonephila clavipes]